MRPDELNQDNLERVIDVDNQSILVSGDVKANSIIGQNAGIAISGFYVIWRGPVRLINSLMPCL